MIMKPYFESKVGQALTREIFRLDDDGWPRALRVFRAEILACGPMVVGEAITLAVLVSLEGRTKWNALDVLSMDKTDLTVIYHGDLALPLADLPGLEAFWHMLLARAAPDWEARMQDVPTWEDPQTEA